jgi:hypothetical protein
VIQSTLHGSCAVPSTVAGELRVGKRVDKLGGVSGIGLAMAQAFLNEDINVAMADVDAEALSRAKACNSGSWRSCLPNSPS